MPLQSLSAQHLYVSGHCGHVLEPPHPEHLPSVPHFQSVMGPAAAGFVHVYEVGAALGFAVGFEVVGRFVGAGDG